MSQTVLIADLIAGETIDAFYAVKDKTVRQTRAGKDYIDIVLMDRTGTVSAKVWDDAAAASELFSKGDMVKVRALVGTYNDQIDLSIKKIRRTRADDPFDPADMILASPFPVDIMERDLRQVLDRVTDDHLRKLLDSFLEDPAFMEKFRKSTASKMIHHPYAGGLLEHTLSVVQILGFLSDHYPELNRDILITGGFLHDIGKMRELSRDPDMSYTDEGLLIGHMVLGADMVREKMSAIPGFPERLAMEMVHTVLSHQGEREWGSPVLPATREALIIHFVDNMDAKQFAVKRGLDESKTEGSFTDKVYPLGRQLFKRNQERE